MKIVYNLFSCLLHFLFVLLLFLSIVLKCFLNPLEHMLIYI